MQTRNSEEQVSHLAPRDKALPRGTIRPTEQSRAINSSQGRVVESTNTEPQGRISFLDLPTDIFVKLLDWFEITDVLNLRRVCKGLQSSTQLHATWALLATHYVTARNLPWPAWALPVSEVPSATLEHLTLRALRMERLWDGGDRKTNRRFSRFIQRPRESITWIRLIHSRWLVIQQDEAVLELWDLEDVGDKRPVLTIGAFEGIVDGSVVRSRGGSSVAMIISTRSCKSGRIELFLPYPKAGSGSASAKVVDSFDGFSRLMDADEQLAAFLHHEGNHSNFIRDMFSGAVVRLDPSQEYPQPQQALAIQLKSQVVAVATVWSIDLYWRETILTALRSAEAGSVRIQPFQRLSYHPGCLKRTPEDVTIASASFLAGNPRFTSLPAGEHTIFLCAQGNIQGRILHVAQLIETTPRGPPTYILLPPVVLFLSNPYDIPFYTPGESGRRSVYVVDDRRGLSLCKVSVLPNLVQHVQRLAKRDYIGCWRITDSASKDLVHRVAFDEATGTCAIAMGSGRIWIADLINSEIIPKNYRGPLDMPAEDVAPQPDPAWPITHSIPWPTVIRDRSPRPYFNQDSSQKWSTDVEAYYPARNTWNCFGGAPWFTNEALNIPGPASSLFFNVPTGKRQSPDVEIIAAGGRLLAVLRIYDYEAYSIVLFDQGVQLDDIIMRLREGGTVHDLPSNKVLCDRSPLERYATWRGRVEPISFRHMW